MLQFIDFGWNITQIRQFWVQQVLGDLSLGVKQARHEADHSPQYSAKGRKGHSSSLLYVFMACTGTTLLSQVVTIDLRLYYTFFAKAVLNP
jgi:hypothetical protein